MWTTARRNYEQQVAGGRRQVTFSPDAYHNANAVLTADAQLPFTSPFALRYT